MKRSADALVLPRRLAIALMAEAQKAGGDPVAGVITAQDGAPASVQPGGADSSAVWARYRSGVSEPDAAPGRQLLVSIDLKGVLQVRCFENAGGAPAERELRIE